MWALPITNGCSPKVFDNLTLNFFPPALICTTKRRVWFRNVWAFVGSAGCAAVAHVPIQ
jgi:hypothetical protein